MNMGSSITQTSLVKLVRKIKRCQKTTIKFRYYPILAEIIQTHLHRKKIVFHASTNLYL